MSKASCGLPEQRNLSRGGPVIAYIVVHNVISVTIHDIVAIDFLRAEFKECLPLLLFILGCGGS